MGLILGVAGADRAGTGQPLSGTGVCTLSARCFPKPRLIHLLTLFFLYGFAKVFFLHRIYFPVSAHTRFMIEAQTRWMSISSLDLGSLAPSNPLLANCLPLISIASECPNRL